MPDNPEALAQSPRVSDHHEYARLLRHVDLFAGLDRVTLAKLAAHLQPVFYAAGSTILRQGDAGDAFYLVASGSVSVYATERTGTAETTVWVMERRTRHKHFLSAAPQ